MAAFSTAAAIIGSAALGAVGANSQAKAAKKVANAQVAAADAATALERETYYDQRALLAPTITAGASARARQMLMQGYSADEVKAYLRSTSAAVNAPAAGAPDGADTNGTGGPRTYMGINNPFYEGETGTQGPQTIDAVPGEDYSWVDNYNWKSSSPSYDFRLKEGQKALERSKAAGGDYFSGDTALALNKYGQDYASNEWEQDWRRLGQLAGDGTDATGTTVNVAGQYGSAAANNTIAAGNARASGYQQAGNAWGNFWQGAAGIPMYAQGQGWFGKG